MTAQQESMVTKSRFAIVVLGVAVVANASFATAQVK